MLNQIVHKAITFRINEPITSKPSEIDIFSIRNLEYAILKNFLFSGVRLIDTLQNLEADKRN